MEYAYAALMLNETDAEIDETNLKAVLTAAEADVIESRVKALVAALEDVDVDEVAAADPPAPTTGSVSDDAGTAPDGNDAPGEDGRFGGLPGLFDGDDEQAAPDGGERTDGAGGDGDDSEGM